MKDNFYYELDRDPEGHANGYTVFSSEGPVYSAGNNSMVSFGSIPWDDPFALSEETLEIYAKQTTEEMRLEKEQKDGVD